MTVKINELIIRAEISAGKTGDSDNYTSYPNEKKLKEIMKKVAETEKPKNKRER